MKMIECWYHRVPILFMVVLDKYRAPCAYLPDVDRHDHEAAAGSQPGQHPRRDEGTRVPGRQLHYPRYLKMYPGVILMCRDKKEKFENSLAAIVKYEGEDIKGGVLRDLAR